MQSVRNLSEEILSQFAPGDRVSVTWSPGPSGPGKECYPREGVVVQVTDRFIVIRTPQGYAACASIADLATGTNVKKRGSDSRRSACA